MRFTKSHGAGNDFIVIDARSLTRDWNALAKQMCDRHFGVGSDGIILVEDSPVAELRMRMFNPDGSEAEACGNGLRCFVKYAADNRLVQTQTFQVDTLGGIRKVTAFPGDGSPVTEAEVSMGVPHLQGSDIPALVSGLAAPILTTNLEVLDITLALSLVSMGNPHAVAFMDEGITDFALGRYGPTVEHHHMFPARINFEIAQLLGPHDVKARVWERGAGETLACGTGACAIAVAARLNGYCSDNIHVHLPGGTLSVTWGDLDEEVLLRGPVKEVFTGNWPE